MSIHFAVGRYGEPCGICGRKDLPAVHLWHSADPDVPIPVCIDCLAGAIELPTKWRVRTTVARWHTVSDAAAAFKDLGQTRKRSRRSKTL